MTSSISEHTSEYYKKGDAARAAGKKTCCWDGMIQLRLLHILMSNLQLRSHRHVIMRGTGTSSPSLPLLNSENDTREAIQHICDFWTVNFG